MEELLKASTHHFVLPRCLRIPWNVWHGCQNTRRNNWSGLPKTLPLLRILSRVVEFRAGAPANKPRG